MMMKRWIRSSKSSCNAAVWNHGHRNNNNNNSGDDDIHENEIAVVKKEGDQNQSSFSTLDTSCSSFATTLDMSPQEENTTDTDTDTGDENKIVPYVLPKGAELILREIAASHIFRQELYNVICVRDKSQNEFQNGTYCHDYPTGRRKDIDWDFLFGQMITEFPGLAQQQYEIEWDHEETRLLRPLTIVCCLQPTLETVKTVYEAFPGAISLPEGPQKALPLHFASTFGASAPVLQFLMDKYPESVKTPRGDSLLPLHCAAYFKASLSSITCLVQTWPEAIHALDQGGKTPLHQAALGGTSLEVVQYLYEQCPHNIGQEDSNRRTPFFLASHCRPTGTTNRTVVQYLKQQLQVFQQQQHEQEEQSR